VASSWNNKLALSAAALAAFAMPVALCAQSGIVATMENGHRVFVNNDAPAPALAAPADGAAPTTHLVYWSNTQHRWKPVPTPSRKAMRGAQSAAAEVRAIVARTPMTPLPTSTRSESPFAEFSSPDTRGITTGHRITQSQVDVAIDAAAARHHVDANLVRSIIKVESNFNPHAVSRKGAMGLMQLMPSTARELNVTNPFDVEQNVEAGTKHFKGLLDNFNGDVSKSLAAYNAGAGAVTRHGGVPPYAETRDYVKRITKLYGQDNPFPAVASTSIHVDRDGAGRKIFTNE
jgi:hypothetical protein